MRRWRARRWFERLTIVVVGVFLLVVILFDVIEVGAILPPRAAQPTEMITLDQNWSPYDAQWFHHASQGTRIMRYDWFMAIEQPELHVLLSPKLVRDSAYLQRFGFLPDLSNGEYSNGLPVGFATEEGFQEPYGRRLPKVEPYKVVGLTCAACHTGQVNYQGRGIRIEGGPANVDLRAFQTAIERALFFTRWAPGRFGRFATRVLGENDSPEARAKLFAQLDTLISEGLEEELYAKHKHLNDLQGGPGRTDALGLIGNRAFKDLNSPENLAMSDAPVNFPPLWDTSWFEWVQYNASIRPPMVRNIGEALGVGAIVVTNELKGDLYDSTVNVANLHRMERQIAGKKPFEGLRSPVWPESLLGELDSNKVRSGRALFVQHCQGCHLAVDELKRSPAGAGESYKAWVAADDKPPKLEEPVHLIALKTYDLQIIGTDPAQALNMQKRVVYTPKQALTEGIALLQVTAGVRERKYAELHLTPDQQREYDGYRTMPTKNLTDPEQAKSAVAANLGYRPRPLDGIWATAPYLHNGSVPNLYELLSPVANRSKTFNVGGREFDPISVGFKSKIGSGSFSFDTTKPGNLNTGHEFRNLRLEEFENLRPIATAQESPASDDHRWAIVLEMRVDDFKALSAEKRFSRITQASAANIPRLRKMGVLGPEFTHQERWALIEYLKTL